MTFDLPDGTNDPTAEGGLLEIFDDSPFTPAGVDFTLPAGGWKGLGNAGSKGFKYKGAGSPTDPCRVVLVKEKVVKAVCKGPDVTLPTPFQGQVGIALTVGTDSKRYCALFGGDEVKNDGTLLKRKDAAAPAFCPLDLNSSTTTTSTSSTTTTTNAARCCQLPNLYGCTYDTGYICELYGGVVSEPGSVCHASEGVCGSLPATTGPCCGLDSADGSCVAGPLYGEFFSACALLHSGGLYAEAVCTPNGCM
jgi:hypothetical protein